MKQSMKSQLAKTLGSNTNLNKKAIEIKKSWDEVNGLLNSASKSKKSK